MKHDELIKKVKEGDYIKIKYNIGLTSPDGTKKYDIAIGIIEKVNYEENTIRYRIIKDEKHHEGLSYNTEQNPTDYEDYQIIDEKRLPAILL